MSDDYAELVKRMRSWSGTHDVADAIEALIRERDELDFLKWEGGEESVGREIERAYQRGFKDGLEKAAAEADRDTDENGCVDIRPYHEIAAAIRALAPEPFKV